MIYSMLVVMQAGFGASVIEAAPVYAQNPQGIVQLDNRQEHNQGKDRRQEHDNRQKQENERHEREMRRRPNENRQEWHRRQDTENNRHNNELQSIAALLVGVVIGVAVS